MHMKIMRKEAKKWREGREERGIKELSMYMYQPPFKCNDCKLHTCTNINKI